MCSFSNLKLERTVVALAGQLRCLSFMNYQMRGIGHRNQGALFFSTDICITSDLTLLMKRLLN